MDYEDVPSLLPDGVVLPETALTALPGPLQGWEAAFLRLACFMLCGAGSPPGFLRKHNTCIVESYVIYAPADRLQIQTELLFLQPTTVILIGHVNIMTVMRQWPKASLLKGSVP